MANTIRSGGWCNFGSFQEAISLLVEWKLQRLKSMEDITRGYGQREDLKLIVQDVSVIDQAIRILTDANYYATVAFEEHVAASREGFTVLSEGEHYDED